MKAPIHASLSCAMALALVACSPSKTPEQQLQQAQTFIANNDAASAVITLKNLIQQNNKNIQARSLLAEAYLKQGDYSGAEKEFKRAIELGDNTPRTFILLAKTYLSSYKYDQAIDILEEQRFTENSDKIERGFILTQALLAIDKAELAKQHATEIYQLDPNNQYSQLAQILLLANDQKITEALTNLEPLVTKHPKFSEAILLQASLFNKQQQFNKAAKAYQQYMTLAPNNIGAKLLAVNALLKSNQFDEAKALLDQLNKTLADNPTVQLLSAQYAFAQKDYQQAKQLSERVSQRLDSNLAKLIAGISNYYLNNNEQAYSYLIGIKDKLPAEHAIHKVIAVLQFKLGYSKALNEQLNSLTNLTEQDVDLLTEIGLGQAQRGDLSQAQKTLEKAEKLSPNNAQLKAKQGIVKIFNADISGIDDLQQAIKIQPDLAEANVALAMAYLNQGKEKQAQEIAEHWQKQASNNPAPLILKGNIALKQKQYQQAVHYFDQALALDENNQHALFNKAVCLFESGDYDQSNQFIEQLLAKNIEHKLSYRLLISNAVKLNQEQQLEQKIKSLVTEHPNALMPRIVLAKRLTAKRKFDEALTLLAATPHKQQSTPIFLDTIANVELKANKFDQAEQHLIQWQKLTPNNKTPYVKQITLLDSHKRYKDALAVTQLALQQSALSQDFQLRSLEAYYLLFNQQQELAAQKINALEKDQPEHAFILRLKGHLAFIRKQYHTAEKLLRRAYQKHPDIFTGMLLANSLKLQNKPQQAADFLKTELAKNNDILPFKDLLAELNTQLNPEESIDYYQHVVKQNPKNFVALNNLAWLLMEKNQLKQAQEYAQSARKLAPKHPQILDTLGLILTKQQNYQQAITVLEQARELAKQNAEITIHLAQAYKANNELAKAKQLIQGLSISDKQKWQQAINTI